MLLFDDNDDAVVVILLFSHVGTVELTISGERAGVDLGRKAVMEDCQ